MSTRRILHTLLKQTHGGEVRHLLIHSVDSSRETNLSQLTAAVNIPIATGTEYEMGQRAETLSQDWIDNEGFRFPRERELVFEPLKHTIVLATAIGNTGVYDPKYQNIQRNLTGKVPLSSWPGVTAKNGGAYEYAFDGMKIVAQPRLPPNHGLNLQPKTNEEFLVVLQKAVALRDAIGPTVEFLLSE